MDVTYLERKYISFNKLLYATHGYINEYEDKYHSFYTAILETLIRNLKQKHEIK